MKKLLYKIGLIAALIFQSCGDPVNDQCRHGGGIEIPNGINATVAVRLTDSSGVTLARTKVFLVAGESWATRIEANESVIVDSVETDSLGTAVLQVTESKMFLLARYKNQGVHMALQPKDSAGTDLANPMLVVLGSLATLVIKSEENQQLAVFGTPWRFTRGSDKGDYVLDTVPQGEYMPVALESRGLQMGQPTKTVLFDTLTDVTSVTFSDPHNLMLTNFENQRLQAIWDPVHVGGYWWATATVDEIASWEHFGIETLDEILDSSEGNVFASVNVQFLNKDNVQSLDTRVTVANFGLDFSTQPVNTNLSKATHISFKGRGSGSWEFRLQTQDSSSGVVLSWTYPLAISEEWQQFKIPLDDFVCVSDSTKMWADELRLGTNLFWQTKNDSRIQVDDIILNGFEFEDWVDP